MSGFHAINFNTLHATLKIQGTKMGKHIKIFMTQDEK